MGSEINHFTTPIPYNLEIKEIRATILTFTLIVI